MQNLQFYTYPVCNANASIKTVEIEKAPKIANGLKAKVLVEDKESPKLVQIFV
jgi:hypothetical protein